MWTIMGLLMLTLFSAFCFVVGSILFFSLASGNDMRDKGRYIIFSFIAGFATLMSPLTIICRDVQYTYVSPASIIRTNDMTHVIYIHEGKTFTWDLSDIKSWNAREIVVKQKSGYNLFGTKMRDQVRDIIIR